MEIIILGVILGIVLITSLAMCLYLTYMEEKNKCYHKWEEVSRSNWKNNLGGEFIKVELKCEKCGEVTCRRL